MSYVWHWSLRVSMLVCVSMPLYPAVAVMDLSSKLACTYMQARGRLKGVLCPAEIEATHPHIYTCKKQCRHLYPHVQGYSSLYSCTGYIRYPLLAQFSSVQRYCCNVVRCKMRLIESPDNLKPTALDSALIRVDPCLRVRERKQRHESLKCTVWVFVPGDLNVKSGLSMYSRLKNMFSSLESWTWTTICNMTHIFCAWSNSHQIKRDYRSPVPICGPLRACLFSCISAKWATQGSRSFLLQIDDLIDRHELTTWNLRSAELLNKSSRSICAMVIRPCGNVASYSTMSYENLME